MATLEMLDQLTNERPVDRFPLACSPPTLRLNLPRHARYLLRIRLPVESRVEDPRCEWPPTPHTHPPCARAIHSLSLIHISEPTRQAEISYAVFCLKKK